MVVVLMHAAGNGAAVIAKALAAETGWPVIESPDARALPATVAGTLGRREHLVIASASLTPDEQQRVRGGLHLVRFVSLADHAGTTEEIVLTIRREFGL
jgi:hypothetical protein